MCHYNKCVHDKCPFPHSPVVRHNFEEVTRASTIVPANVPVFSVYPSNVFLRSLNRACLIAVSRRVSDRMPRIYNIHQRSYSLRTVHSSFGPTRPSRLHVRLGQGLWNPIQSIVFLLICCPCLASV